jgi:hypothetical protein
MSQSFCYSSPAEANGPLLKVVSSSSVSPIEWIYEKIWALSPKVGCTDSYLELSRLTAELITIYELQGRLKSNPFNSARERKVNLNYDPLLHELKDSTCIVTGGLGCVGSILVKKLLEFKVKNIIILDIDTSKVKETYAKEIICLHCDIRDLQKVKGIFFNYSPDFVFHTAAQRDPGYAESHIVETTTTNVLGTLNIAKACEATGSVKQMIFSSTGKSSRYFTEEIYSATKKMDEFILDTYAKESSVKYSMVRFTHILDNSLMNIELRDFSTSLEYVSIHSPGKYVTAQNATEAAGLMLNAILHSEPKQCNLLLVRYLDWPVESLEVALYYIKQSKRAVPVIFVGNPIGYSEKFFRGQMDWSNPCELNLLINVYEQKHRRLNPEEDIIISRPCSTNKQLLKEVIDRIAIAKGERETGKALVDGLKDLVTESLLTVDKEDTTHIIRWGLDPNFLETGSEDFSCFNKIISLLIGSLVGSKYDMEIEENAYQKQA